MYNESLRETISLNESDLIGNAELAMDLLADDFLLFLGYDKRKDKGIRKLSSVAYKIEIENQDKFIVEFRGYGDNLLTVNKQYFENGYSFVISTDGMAVSVLTPDNGVVLHSKDIYFVKDKLEYKKISILKLIEEAQKLNIDYERAYSIVNNNIENITNYIIKLERLGDTKENKEKIQSVLSEKREDSSKDNNTPADSFEDREKDYRVQITSLTSQKEILAEELTNVKKELKALKESQITEKEAKLGIAKTLIEAVEDDPESDRLYVGAVNSKLFQNKELGKFIGNCINELYNIVKFKLMTVLYDGEFFKFKSPVTRADFIINSKKYEIDFSNESEQSAIGKLQILFERFPEDCIAFECKLVGKEPDIIEDEIEYTEEPEEDDFTENEDFSEESDNSDDIFDDSEIDAEDTEDDLFEEMEPLDNGSEFEDDETLENLHEASDKEIFDSIEESDLFGDDNSEGLDRKPEIVTLKVPLDKLGEVAWNDAVEIISINYIGNNETEYKVINDDSIERALSKIIDAEICLCDNTDSAISSLRNADCSEISAFINTINASNRKNPKISFTNYVIDEIDKYTKCIPIITSIAEIIGLNTVYVYLYITVKSETDIFNDLINAYESINETERTEIEYTDLEEENVQCILMGNIVDNIILTRNSLSVQKKLFKQCLALKTKYCTLDISNNDNKEIAMQEILNQATKDFDVSAVGNIIDTEYKIINDRLDGVSDDYYQIEALGNVYYVSKMEEWQFIYALIKINTVITKNKQIAIKCYVDKNALEFYDNQFKSLEPSFTLSVKTLLSYVKAKIK